MAIFRFIDFAEISSTSGIMKIFSSGNWEEFISKLLDGDQLIIFPSSLDYPSTFEYGSTAFNSLTDILFTHSICHQENLVKNYNWNTIIS